MARVRISILAVILLYVAAASAQVVLPDYVGEGATTVCAITNPLDHSVKFPDSTACTPLGCTVKTGIALEPSATIRIPVTPPANGYAGIYQVVLPDPALIVESEVVTGAGALFRRGPLTANTTFQFYNCGHEGPYNCAVFYAAAGPQVFGGRQLAANEAWIFSVPSATFRVVSQLGRQGYAFAVVNSQTNGSLQIIDAATAP